MTVLPATPTPRTSTVPPHPEKTRRPSCPSKAHLRARSPASTTLTDAQEAELLGGMWYFNLHTAQYPDGELRGQVYAVGDVVGILDDEFGGERHVFRDAVVANEFGNVLGAVRYFERLLDLMRGFGLG